MGKYLFSAGQAGLWEPIRPIVLPFFLGIFSSLPLLFSRLFIIVVAAATLVLFYYLCRQRFNIPQSVLATFFLAATPLYVLYATKLMTGMLAVFFVLLGYYLYTKQHYYWMGLVLGLAAATRFPAALFFIILFVASIRKTKWYYVLGLFIIPLLPYVFLNYSTIISSFISAMLHQNNLIYAKPWWFYGKTLLIQGLFFVAALPGIYFATKKKQYVLLALALIPLLYFQLIDNKQERFLLLALPFLVLLAWEALFLAQRWKKGLQICTIVFLLVSVVLSISFFSFPNEELPTYAQFFENETVLTATPLPTLHGDAKLIPYYFSYYEGFITYLEYEDSVDFVLHTNTSFPCKYADDTELCEETLKAFHGRLENRTFFYEQTTEATYTIYQ
tara:strand:- start:4260 stop:5423 length:1164 start_codon:yes stop_codon:yes gene_type:complete